MDNKEKAKPESEDEIEADPSLDETSEVFDVDTDSDSYY